MNCEYQALIGMTFFFMFAWIPSSLGKWKSFGGRWLASNRDPLPGKELLPWAQRAERAYSNLKDYFPAFVVAILLLGILHKFDETTKWAAIAYVFARLAHFISYSFGNVTVRFLSYTVAMGCNVWLLFKALI